MDFNRDGATVSISADSKDRLALANFGTNRTWKAKRKVVDVIMDMLVNYAGENPARIHLPKGLKATTPEKVTVTVKDEIWTKVRKLAESVGFKIWYDARGHVVMRRSSDSPSFTIDYRSLCSAVRIERPAATIFNRWIVRGPKPRAHKQRIVVDLQLPRKHPWSAWTLGRKNGKQDRHGNDVVVPQWHIDEQEPGQVKNWAAAFKIATKQRRDALRTSNNLSVDHLPFPFVEPYDLARVIDPKLGTFLLRENQHTLPLGNGGPATTGAIRKVSMQPRRHTQAHHHQNHHRGDNGRPWAAA
jgi:hypothetical protein